MNAKKAVSLLACAVLGAASGLAYAGTVDFNVPLNVTSYPGPNVEVWCELRSAQDQPIEAFLTVVNVHNGARQGFTHVKVTYTPQEAGAIRNYRCALVVETKSTLGGGLGSGASGKMYGVKSIPLGATILQQVGGPLQ
ncbi:MAG: hypothetical protein WAU52_14125 [Burkholderiales bacterium]